MNRLSNLIASPRARTTWRLLWVAGTLGAIAIGVAAPGEFDIP